MVTKADLLYWQKHFEFEAARALEEVWYARMLLQRWPNEQCFVENLRRADENRILVRGKRAAVAQIQG